jgi:hypothetical protein
VLEIRIDKNSELTQADEAERNRKNRLSRFFHEISNKLKKLGEIG